MRWPWQRRTDDEPDTDDDLLISSYAQFEHKYGPRGFDTERQAEFYRRALRRMAPLAQPFVAYRYEDEDLAGWFHETYCRP